MCRYCHQSFHKWARYKRTTAGEEQLADFISWKRAYIERDEADRQERTELRRSALDLFLWTGGGGFALADHVANEWVEPEDPRLAARGVFYFWIAGAFMRPEVLVSQAFDPGNQVLLVREAKNGHDRNAIQIWDAHRTAQVGWVPRGLASVLAPMLDRGKQFRTLVMAGDTRREPRTNSSVLIAPELPPVAGTISD